MTGDEEEEEEAGTEGATITRYVVGVEDFVVVVVFNGMKV